MPISPEYGYTYQWRNNPKRETLKGRSCRVVARGKKNSIMIEFENGQREIVSRYSIRKTYKQILEKPI